MARAVLVKYKRLKLLVTKIDASIGQLNACLEALNELEIETQDLSKNMLSPAADKQAAKIKQKLAAFDKLQQDMGLIGSPFTPAKDAELYALSNGINFKVLELHGGMGNKNALKKEANSSLNIRVNSRDKAGWVKQAQLEGLKLSEWVVQKLNSGI